jgi:hypothetical protein
VIPYRWSKDGRYLITAGKRLTSVKQGDWVVRGIAERHALKVTFEAAQVWEVTQGVREYELGAAVEVLDFAPDGKRLLVGSSVWEPVFVDGCLRLRRTTVSTTGLAFPALTGTDGVWGGIWRETPRVKTLGEQQELVALRRVSPQAFQLVIPFLGYRRSDGSGMLMTDGPQVDIPFAHHLSVSPDGKRAAIFYRTVQINFDNFVKRAAFQLGSIQAVASSGPLPALNALMLADPLAPRTPQGRLNDLPRAFDTKEATNLLQSPMRTSSTSIGDIVELWDLERGVKMPVEFRSSRSVQCRFSPDSRRFPVSLQGATGLGVLFTGSGIAVCDAATGNVLQQIKEGIRSADVVFNGDGSRMLARPNSPDNPGRMALIDVDGGMKTLSTWSAEKGTSTFTLSPDGHIAVLGDESGLVRVWDAETGRELARWQAHETKVTALTFHRDGRTLLSGSSDGTLKLWNLSYIRKELAALGLHW